MLLLDLPIFASEYEEIPYLYKKRATAYCLTGKTYTGKSVRKGIAACGDKRLVGKTCVMYQRLPDGSVGNLIGIYEIEDTGCSEYVIDVWMPSDECQDFMNKVYENGCQGKIFIDVLGADG